MANPYFDHTSAPAQGSPLSSAVIRAEFDAIEQGFDKLPTLAGNGLKKVRVNAGGTALEAVVDTVSAANVTNTPAGNIAATNVQAAINELDTEKLATSAIGTAVQAYSVSLDEYAAVNPTAAGLAILDDADAASQRVTLGLVIGTDVQAYATSASQVEMEAGTEAALRAMSPLRVAQAIAALGGGTDQVARDQIALTNMRLMLNSAVTTGELVQGKQWELETDEWAASSTGETYVSAALDYYTGTSTVAVSQGAGTVLGNMTANGGLAAAFDGNANQTRAVGADTGSAVAAGYVGKDWGIGVTKTITQAVVDSANDNGFSNSFNSGTNTLTLEGSTDNFSSSVVSLGSTVTGTDGGVRITSTVTATDTSTAYRYHRIKITNSNGGTQVYCCAEVVFMEQSFSDITLVPPAAVSVSSAPSYMVAYLLWKDDSGSAVLGTDFTVELSRDNGTTYTAATLTNMGAFDSTYSALKARADVSAQPSGTSMLCRIKTLNSKEQRVAAPALYSE